MGKFKRYDGYVMHIPQEFIDNKLPVCPFCKSDHPHWLLDSRMEFSLAGSRTYYQCECCRATMSSTAADAAAEKGKGFGINPAMAAMNAAQKGSKHQEVGVAYMRIEDLGFACQDTSLLGQELPITFLQEMAAPAKVFCTNCGQELTPGNAFCPSCGAKQEVVPAPEAYAAPVAPAVNYYEAPADNGYAPAPANSYNEAPVNYYNEAPVNYYNEPSYDNYRKPVAPVAAPAAPYKFPLVPLILMGIAAMYAFISLFSGYSFLEDFLRFTPYVLLVVGLITCRKEKNVLFGVGFLVYAGITFLSLLMYSGYYFYSALDIVVSLFTIAATILIGVSYLVAKPAMRVLKMIAAIVSLAFSFISFISYIEYINYIYFINLVCGALPFVAVILYTPFKKD